MTNKKFYVLLAGTLGSIAIGTAVIYRKIDAFRRGICHQKQWYYMGTDGKYHDLI